MSENKHTSLKGEGKPRKDKKSRKEKGRDTKVVVEETDQPAESSKEKKKKRKRDDEDNQDTKKASKKSKKSKKKDVESVNLNSQTEQSEPAAPQEKTSRADTALQQDFIQFETDPADNGAARDTTTNTISRKGSKKNKSKKKTKQSKAEEPIAREEPANEANGTNTSSGDAQGADESEQAASKKDRFIVFVGNLPFTATKQEMQIHFEKIKPKDIRMMTDKKTGKPKGFAFVEFDKFDSMQTCLKKYNHSIFPDKKQGRKINIELTAGGGGNNSSRKYKIEEKNEKLSNERQRDHEKRDEIEAKQKERQEKKDSREGKSKKGNANGASGDSEPAVEHGAMHPSRLAMIQTPTSREPTSQRWQPKRTRY